MMPGSASRRASPKSVTQMLPLPSIKQVGRLDVAMNHALLVGVREGVGRLESRPRRPSENRRIRAADRRGAARRSRRARSDRPAGQPESRPRRSPDRSPAHCAAIGRRACRLPDPHEAVEPAGSPRRVATPWLRRPVRPAGAVRSIAAPSDHADRRTWLRAPAANPKTAGPRTPRAGE